MSQSSNCPICGSSLDMDTDADREAAREHIADCARNGNGGEVVQAKSEKPAKRWEVKS